MNKYELQYKWEENKRKILAGVGVFAGFVLVGGGIMMLTYNRLYNETAGPQVMLAKNVLVHGKEGTLDLYAIEEGEKIDSLSLPESFLLSANQNLDKTYVYDKTSGKLQRVSADDDELVVDLVKDVDDSLLSELIKATDFEATDEWFAFKTEDAFHVIHNEDETKRMIRIDDDEEITAWSINDQGLYTADGDFLSFVNFEEAKERRIEIGDTTTSLHPIGEYMMAHNDFGSSKDESILLRITGGSLHIEELKSLGAMDYVKPQVPADENQLVFIDVDRNEEGTAVRKRLIVQNAISVDDKQIDEPLTLELTTKGDFNTSQLLASNGFLYNYEDKEQTIGISELRNGREYKTLFLDSMNEKLPYFLPLYED